MNPLSCEAVRRESAGSAEVELSPGSRAHLAECVACAVALADGVVAAAGDLPTAPRAARAIPEALRIAAPLAAEDARRMGWLFARNGLRPSWLSVGVLAALGVAFMLGFPARREEAPASPRQNVWKPVIGDLGRGLPALEATPGGAALIAGLKEKLIDPEARHKKTPLTDEELFTTPWLRARVARDTVMRVRLLEHALAARSALEAASAPEGAFRALHALALNLAVRDPGHQSKLKALLRATFERGGREYGPLDRAEPVPALAWACMGLVGSWLDEPSSAALCERAIELRWRVLRQHGPQARGLPGMWDAHCALHQGHAEPGMGGDTTGLLGSLAAARLLHHWRRGWSSTLGALADRDWLVPDVVWLFRSTIPGVAGSLLFLALWVAGLALRRRRALADGLELAPDRGTRTVLGASAVLALALPAVLLAGGAVWWLVRAVMVVVLDSSSLDMELENLVGQPIGMLYDQELVALPDGVALAVLVASAALAVLFVFVQQRLLRWVEPDYAPGFKVVLVPFFALVMLAWQSSRWGESGLTQPLVLGGVLLSVLPWLRREGTVRERRFATFTIGACIVLLVTNAMRQAHPEGSSFIPVEQTAVGAVMAAVLVVLPAACGYLLGHLPPGTWRLQRMLALASVSLGPALFASLALRVSLASAVDRQGVEFPATLALALAAFAVLAVQSLLLGARCTPPGAAALRDPARPGWPGRLLSLGERSPAALSAWLLLGWLVGHLGILSTQIPLF